MRGRFAAGALVVALSAVAAGVAWSAGATKLSASIAAKPGVSAIFLATVNGNTLTWRLTVRGVKETTSLRIRLGRGGPAVASLCAPCSRSQRGTTQLSDGASTAVAAGKGYLDFRSKNMTLRKQVRIVQGVPTLEITSLHDGDAISLPASISYRISNYAVGAAPLGHVELAASGLASPIEIPLTGQEGTFTLPDVKSQFLVGHRNLTFMLASADRTPVPNAEAHVTIRDVTVQGRR